MTNPAGAPGRRRRPSDLAVVAAAAMVVAVAVGAPAGAASAYEEVEVRDGGVLTGTVRFAGARPRPAPIAVTRNRDVCGEQVLSEALVVGPEGGVKGAVVMLRGVRSGKRPAGEVVLDSAGCLFVPHVAATVAGGRVRVKNSDPILHSPHGVLDRPIFTLALPGRGQVIDIGRHLTRPGVVRILCDAHPHMSGWLVVHDSPYVAVTDERGAYRIEAIPPGPYRVTLWHEGWRARGVDRDGRPIYDEPRSRTQKVIVTPGGTVTLDFELS